MHYILANIHNTIVYLDIHTFTIIDLNIYTLHSNIFIHTGHCMLSRDTYTT